MCIHLSLESIPLRMTSIWVGDVSCLLFCALGMYTVTSLRFSFSVGGFFFQTGHSFDDVDCLGDGLPLFVFIPTKLGPELYIITFIAAGVCG